MKWPRLSAILAAAFFTFSPLITQAEEAKTVSPAAEGSSFIYADTPPPSAYDLSDGNSLRNSFVSEDHAFMAQGIKSLLVLSAVILLAYFCLKLLKRFMDKSGFSSSGEDLRVIKRVALDAKNSVHIVQINKRYFLIGTSEHSICQLAELKPEDIIAKSPQELSAEVSPHG